MRSLQFLTEDYAVGRLFARFLVVSFQRIDKETGKRPMNLIMLKRMDS